MRRFRLLAICIAIAPAASPAQDWSATGHYLRLTEADLGNARMSGREQGLQVTTPDFDALGGRFAIGAGYVYTHYSYTGLPTRDRDLHRLAVPLTWSNEGTVRLHVEATPTVATSSNIMKDLFSRAGSEDVNLYGRIVAERIPETGWGWRAGAGYDDRFGDPQAWPQLAALYRSPSIAIELGWPRTGVEWTPHPAWQFGLDVAPAGRFWHVVSDERGGAEFDYVVEAWRATLSGRWTFAPHWHLAAQLGSEFDRHHDFEDDTGARIDEDAESTAFVALALGMTF